MPVGSSITSVLEFIVFCRIRPLNPTELENVIVISNLRQPNTYLNYYRSLKLYSSIILQTPIKMPVFISKIKEEILICSMFCLSF